MADDTTPPTPAPTPTPAPWTRYVRYAAMLLMAVLPVVSAIATKEGCPKVVERIEYIEKTIPLLDEFTPTFGWLRDEEVVAANLDPTLTLHFADTPAGMAALGDEDVFLWRAARKAAGLDDKHYPNVNQQSVGCCVGCGWKHSCDIVQATAIASGKAFEWKPASVEVIYAGSRVDVGKGRISGDGSVGSWAKEYVTGGGIAAMTKYASADLTTFSPSRARQWGRSGAPADVKAAARTQPVKGCALVKSWADTKRAIQQGYPVAVCSNQGFRMDRDATGKARPQGSWPHCMCICGVRANSADGSVKEGGFILNSWGDTAHTGPVWPPDMPVAGFWADAAVIDRMVAQGDSFALSDVVGFPSRRIDWLIRGPADIGRERLTGIMLRSPFAIRSGHEETRPHWSAVW
jgi:hypothetical protein